MEVLVSANIRKRGRPLDSSKYNRCDEQALERMLELVHEGQPVAAAARTVVVEMKIPGTSPEERLRKKFSRDRAKIAARVAARSRPEMPRTRASGRGAMWKQAMEAAEFQKTSEGKALIEHARWIAKNKALLREAIARARLVKP